MCLWPTKLSVVHKLYFFSLLIFNLVVCLSHPVISQAAAGQEKTISANTGQKIQIPQGLSPQAADAYLAGLIDERVRQIVALKLKDPAATAESEDTGTV